MAVYFGSLATVQMMWYTVWTLNCPSIIHPNDEIFPSGPSSVSRSFELFQLASVRTFQQHVWKTISVWPAMGFLSKTQIWEDNCNRPDEVDFVRTRSSIRQVAHSKFRRPDNSLLGPDARAIDMEIAYI